MNFIKISWTAPIAISQYGFFVEFSRDFADDLGTGLQTGDYIPCYSTAQAGLKCKLSKPTTMEPYIRIYISDFGSYSNGQTDTLWIYRIKNPQTAINTALISFAYYENPNGNFFEEKFSVS